MANPHGGYGGYQTQPPGGYQPSAPGQPGGYQPSAPGQPGGYQPSAPGQPGGYQQRPGQPGGYPGQPGGYQQGPPGAGQPGGYPGQPSGYGQPGSYQQRPQGPGQPAGYPGQPGGYQQRPPGGPPGQQGGYPGQPGGYPGQPGGYQGQPSGYPGQPGGFSQPAGPPAGISQEVWGWFQAVDADRSGKISANELQQALTNANWSHFNAETCRLMIGMFDRDRDGTINIQEFQALWNYIQEWQKVFQGFDQDRSGSIDPAEFNNALNQMGYRLSPQFCQFVIRKYDTMGRNSITLDNFIQACVTLKSMTEAFKQKDTSMQGMIRISYEDFLSMVLISQ